MGNREVARRERRASLLKSYVTRLEKPPRKRFPLSDNTEVRFPARDTTGAIADPGRQIAASSDERMGRNAARAFGVG
jgi:hypothetical protein